MRRKDLKAEEEFLEAQAKAIRERVAKKARVYNVLDYGALYFEDDTPAIQAAINAATRAARNE